MREMKDSGVEWVGEIPSEWDFLRGKAIFRQRATKGNTEEVLLSATQQFGMYPQSLIEGVVQVKEETDLQTFKTVHKNDYVISLRSFQGGFEMSDYEGVCSPAYQVLYNIKPIDYRYYKMLFKSDGFISKMNSLTVGIREGKNIQFADFAKTLIPYPPMEEQKRISDYLDSKCAKIDSIIEKQQAIIEKLKEYKLSVITEAVTKGLNPDIEMKDSGIEWIGSIPKHWNLGKVKNGTSKVGSGKTPKGGAEIYVSSGILFLRSQNIYDDGLVLNDPTYISEEIDEEMANTRVYPGDVLLNITGGSIGRCCIFPFGVERANVNQHVSIIRVNKKVFTPEYMHFYWNSEKGKIAISSYQTGGNREGMSGEAISNTPIPIPPLKEQKEIADHIDIINSKIIFSIDKRRKAIEKLQEYKKSLIYEVVTGKKEV